MRWKFARSAAIVPAICFLAVATASGHWFFYENVVSNFSAEEGEASPDGMTIVPIPAWTAAGGATVVAYGTGGDFPTEDDRPADFLEAQLFAGGPGASVSTLFQAIDIPPELWASIDEPLGANYEVAAYLGGFGAEEDHASLSFCVKNAIGEEVVSRVLGPVTASDRNGVTTLRVCWALGVIPSGSRRFELTLTFTRIDGSYNNAFADYVVVRLLPWDGAQPASWGEIKSLYMNRTATR